MLPGVGMTIPEEDMQVGEEKMKRFVLAEEIYLADGEMDIKDDQVVLLKKMIDKAFPSMLVVGQAYRMLEGKGPLKKK